MMSDDPMINVNGDEDDAAYDDPGGGQHVPIPVVPGTSPEVTLAAGTMTVTFEIMFPVQVDTSTIITYWYVAAGVGSDGTPILAPLTLKVTPPSPNPAYSPVARSFYVDVTATFAVKEGSDLSSGEYPVIVTFTAPDPKSTNKTYAGVGAAYPVMAS